MSNTIRLLIKKSKEYQNRLRGDGNLTVIDLKKFEYTSNPKKLPKPFQTITNIEHRKK